MAEQSDLIDKLRSKFPDIEWELQHTPDATVLVPRERIVEVCQFLRDDPDLRFNFLSDLCAVDWLHRAEVDPDAPLDMPRFEVVYHLYSLKTFQSLRLKVLVPEEDPHVATVTGVWSTANWHERETYDMMGIAFDGHPDLRRILTAEMFYDENTEQWKPFEGHPLRKDFSLDYQPVDFTVQKMTRHLARE